MIFQPDDPHSGVRILDSQVSTRRPPVLVVEDMDPVRDLILRLLWADGYRTLAASNGRTAQLLIRAERPCLIITDLNMPGGSGQELLEFCRERVPEIPVLIVSGEVPSDYPDVMCWAAGFLSKPFQAVALRTFVRRLLDAGVPHP